MDLIITIMHGYDYPFVEPFMESLKKVNFKGDLVIFTSESVSKTTKKSLKKNGATLINYNSTFPFIEKYRPAFKNITPNISINNYRFVLYQQYILEQGEKYNNIMLTDVRDVIFQKKPFDIKPADSLFFFLEDTVQTFHHKFNYQWLTDATNAETADSLIDEVVSCAGITIGSKKRVLQYLGFMHQQLEFRPTLQWGLDQGIHNSYIYVQKPEAIKVFSNDEGVVATLGAYQPYQQNADGEVVNSKGQLYAIVHQYDRSGALFATIKAKYIGSRMVQKIKRLYYALMP